MLFPTFTSCWKKIDDGHSEKTFIIGMSSAFISFLSNLSIKINIYFGAPVLALGVIGGILNTLVFLSLRTFRENSCAFYLLVLSMVNVGQLVTGLLPLVMNSAFNIDWNKTSLFYCKFRMVVFQFCVYVSYSSLCFATIDQYFATCSRPRWQRWSNIKLARCLTVVAVIVWALHGIPYGLYLGHVVSPITMIKSCVTTNFIFAQYRAYGASLMLVGLIPVTFTAIFGFLAYRNVQHLQYRTIPLVRQALDKQLTVMVLAQVVVNFFTDIPYELANALIIIPNVTTDPVVWAKLQFAFSFTLLFFYAYFASPFYIYICASERFRRQLLHVIFEMHLNRFRHPQTTTNRVTPDI